MIPFGRGAPARPTGTTYGLTDPLAGAMGTDPNVATCRCDDGQTDQLRDLMAGGMGQLEASHLLWGKGRSRAVGWASTKARPIEEWK